MKCYVETSQGYRILIDARSEEESVIKFLDKIKEKNISYNDIGVLLIVSQVGFFIENYEESEKHHKKDKFFKIKEILKALDRK